MAGFRDLVGKPPLISDWFLVEQPDINAFADVTRDHAFIHVDLERAAKGPFGGTIAHGMFTLSMLAWFRESALPPITGVTGGVNYGFDRIRFMAPVPVGRRIRGVFRIADVTETKPKFWRLTHDVTVEVEGAPQPAAEVRWLIGMWT
jgi:acyl dehydratase